MQSQSIRSAVVFLFARSRLAFAAHSIMALALGAGLSPAHGAAEAPLEYVLTIPMPAVKGRIDHFAVDVARHRLFVAALGNDTVEVIDVEQNRREKSIPGFGEPQGLVYVPALRRLFVANGGADRVDVLDGETLALLRRVQSLSDADNLRYDAAPHRVVVGYGHGALRIMDARSADPVTDSCSEFDSRGGELT